MQKRQKLDHITKELILEVAQNEISIKNIAIALGIKETSLHGLLKKKNIKLSPSLKINKRKDTINQRFGFLKIIEYYGLDEKNRHLWTCECVCGKIVIKLGKYLKEGDTTSCGCKGKGPNGDVPRYFYSGIKARAITIGKKQWNISYEYVCDLWKKQNGKCALTGRSLQFSKNKKEFELYRTTNASLDRINSDLQYEENNVQWVHKDVNRLKGELDNEEFYELCQEAINWRNKKCV